METKTTVNLPKRKNPRLKGFDYSSNNAYFVTICKKGRKNLLSKIVVGNDAYIVPKVFLTRYGRITEKYLKRIPGIDKYVIMPNHLHFIIVKDGAMRASPPTTLSSDVRSLKTLVTKESGVSLWQSSYYDHIIRNEKDYLEIWQYIEDNPAKWAEDKYYNEK